MKWAYTIKNKTKAALLLAVVLGITITTNLLERSRFRQLERSFASIFEDRLMAESYLFHLYENLKERQDLLRAAAGGGAGPDVMKQVDAYQAEREALIAQYAQTYLTEEEETQFNSLNATLEKINRLEADLARQPAGPALEEATAEAFSTISALSDIQTAEGAELREKSKRIIMGSVSTSHLEMTVLIIIGILIQGLIFSSKTLMGGQGQKPGLN